MEKVYYSNLHSLLFTIHVALMPEGTKFFDVVEEASPYKLAVSPRPGVHEQVGTSALVVSLILISSSSSLKKVGLGPCNNQLATHPAYRSSPYTHTHTRTHTHTHTQVYEPLIKCYAQLETTVCSQQ